jgi:ATP adenylyltransferase
MPTFRPRTLWQLVQSTTAAALNTRALEPIATTPSALEDAGVTFLARMVASTAGKPQLSHEDYDSATAPNPFLPCEPALFVGNASATHACVLNKYCVVDHHLLIVTRHFEHQESALTVADFEALYRCLAEYRSLGFYNSGTVAGASQPHKHLQLVPLPMTDGARDFPLQQLLERTQPPAGRVTRLSSLPFAHAAYFWDHDRRDGAADRGRVAVRVYRALLAELGIRLPDDPDGRIATGYNLLVTGRWMLLIRRRRECFRSISLNGLAFSGAFLVPDEKRLALLRQAGPLAALRWTAPP